MALLALVIKDIKQLLRDPKTLVMVLLMPILVMAMFVAGYGGKGGSVSIVVVDLDRSPVSWQLIDALRSHGNFKVRYFVSTPEAGETLVRRGKAYAAVIIPKGFSESVLAGKPTHLELVLDSSYASVSELVWEAAIVAVQAFQRSVSERYGTFAVNVIRRTVYGPKVTRVENFFAVVMGILLHLVPMSLIAVSISRERERKTFEQLIMTPIRSSDIVLSKLIAYAAVTLADMLVTLAVSVAVFGVRVRGSFADLVVVSSLLLLCSLSLGLLISVISRNQLQAYQTAIFVFIPSLLFSGFFTPVDLLSPQVQMISRLLPLYYFLRAFRSILLRGWSLEDNTSEVMALGLETLLFLVLAIKLLKLRVD